MCSNRLVGDYVMTQNNIAEPRSKLDSIGVGDWSFDEHMTGKSATYHVIFTSRCMHSIASGAMSYTGARNCPLFLEHKNSLQTREWGGSRCNANPSTIDAVSMFHR